MKAVDILGRIDRVDDRIGIDMRGQRQLHQNAVNRRVGIQLRDQRQQLHFGRFSGQLVLETRHAGWNGLNALVADINGAGQIVSYQHHCQSWHDALFRIQYGNGSGDLLAQAGGNGFSVDQMRAHGFPSPVRRMCLSSACQIEPAAERMPRIAM